MARTRKSVVSIGSLSGVGSTAEADISEASAVWLYVKNNGSSTTNLQAEVADEPVGTAATTWYKWGTDQSNAHIKPAGNASTVYKVPAHLFSEGSNTHRRLRFTTTSGSMVLTDMYVELIKVIA